MTNEASNQVDPRKSTGPRGEERGALVPVLVFTQVANECPIPRLGLRTSKLSINTKWDGGFTQLWAAK